MGVERERIESVITLEWHQDQLEERDQRNQSLVEELSKAKSDLEEAKSKHKSEVDTLNSHLLAQSDHGEKLNSLLYENTSLNSHLEETKAALCLKDEELSTLQLTKQKCEADLLASNQVQKYTLGEA